jgi:predicted N-acetyltransferase YhbS
MKTQLEVLIRPARQEDTPDMIEVTNRIWDGQDYIPQVWAEWLEDARGCLLVAEYEGRVVGLAKLTEITPEDWWMQGLRVHPEFQGHGIASKLNDAVLDYWQEHGRGAVRLSTHIERYPVHHMCERTGFVKAGEYSYFQAPAVNDLANEDDQPDFQTVTPEQAGEALTYAENSPIRALTLDYMDLGWEWLPPRLEKITANIARGQIYWWRERQGLLLMNVEAETDERGPIPYLEYIACRAELFVDMLLDYRRLAGQHGYANAGWSPPLHTGLLPYLTSAGFERKWDGAIYLFEKSKTL